jgi:tRNA(Ile)-lysidine synthase
MTDPLLDRLARRASWPASSSGGVLVACSGGADSLALLALAVHAGLDVTAGHVDHGLHPERALDIGVVETAATQLGVPVVRVAVSIDASANIEARAREARYRALREMADVTRSVYIFTGHTLDDQAETVLLAMLRGSGLNGLAGIPARRGALVRPLLSIRRRETLELCRTLGWAPVEDPMNFDVAFTRVWLRREVLPALIRGADRDLVAVLARQADIARDDAEALDALAAELLVDAVASSPESTGGLPVAVLCSAPRAVARRALRTWLPAPVGAEMIDAVLAVAMGHGRAVDVGGGRRVRRSAGRLVVEPSFEATTETSRVGSRVDVALPMPGSVRFGELVVRTRIDRAAPFGWPDGRRTCVVDADAIGSDIVVRLPDPGERFRPVGFDGTKTVAAARSESGITADLRHTLPVVARSDGTIVWVLGYRGAHPARVTASTRRFCWMTVELAAEEHA